VLWTSAVDLSAVTDPSAVTPVPCVRLIYAMLTKGEEYTDRGQAYYDERYRQRVVANLNRRAQQLGLQVVPIAAPA
jgi:transposase